MMHSLRKYYDMGPVFPGGGAGGGTIPDLQQVTDAGNITTDDIIVGDVSSNNTDISNKRILITDSDGPPPSSAEFDSETQIYTQGGTGFALGITVDALGANRTRFEPDEDGTYALLSDIPGTPTLDQVLAAGNFADVDPIISTIPNNNFQVHDGSGHIVTNIQPGVIALQEYPSLDAILVQCEGGVHAILFGQGDVYESSLGWDTMTANRNVTLPDDDGDVVLKHTGNFTQTATVGQTLVTIPHGLPFTPSFADVNWNNSDTAGVMVGGYWINTDSSNIYINLVVPIVGTPGLVYTWFALK